MDRAPQSTRTCSNGPDGPMRETKPDRGIKGNKGEVKLSEKSYSLLTKINNVQKMHYSAEPLIFINI